MTEKTYLRKLEEHKGIIFKVVNLYADELEVRKDLYQEIVYQSWSAYPRFQEKSSFATWLYRISLNVALSHLNKQQKINTLKQSKLDEFYFEPIELSERADKLYRGIKKLAEIDRSIIMLHLDSYSNEEISEITGLSKNNVTVKLHRIKQQLTIILTKQ